MTPVNLQKTSRSSSTIFLQVPFPRWFLPFQNYHAPETTPPAAPAWIILRASSQKLLGESGSVNSLRGKDASNRPENWIPDSLPNKTSPKFATFMFPPKKKKTNHWSQKTPWCRCINQLRFVSFCCSPSRWFFLKKKTSEGTCLTNAAMKRIQNHHQRWLRDFECQELFINSLSHLWWGENIPRKVWCMATKKNGNPFQLNSFKGLLVCPERNSECLIFSRCWRRKPLYIGPIVSP